MSHALSGPAESPARARVIASSCLSGYSPFPLTDRPAPSPTTLAPEFEDFRRQFEQLAADANALAGSLTDAQFTWQPGEGRWSIAQCLEHLNATARAYLPMLDEGIASAIRQGLYGEGPFHYSLLGRFLARSMEPPPRFRVKAPRAFQPEPSRGRHDTLAAFRAYQVQHIDRLRQANGLDLAHARVRSPAGYAWLRIPLGSAFALTTAHGRRHVWQARQVLEAPGFPRA